MKEFHCRISGDSHARGVPKKEEIPAPEMTLHLLDASVHARGLPCRLSNERTNAIRRIVAPIFSEWKNADASYLASSCQNRSEFTIPLFWHGS